MVDQTPPSTGPGLSPTPTFNILLEVATPRNVQGCLSQRLSVSECNKNHALLDLEARPRTFQRLRASEVAMGLCPRSLTNGVECSWLGFIGGQLPSTQLVQTGLERTWQPHTPQGCLFSGGVSLPVYFLGYELKQTSLCLNFVSGLAGSLKNLFFGGGRGGQLY